MNPKVSVILAVWNPHAAFFQQALESILTQTFADFELIIVEDPSERSAAEVIAGWPDARIRYFRQTRRTSLVEQKNRGLSEARGDLVAIFDADDIAVSTRLEKQVRFLAGNPDIDVLGSQIAIINCHGEHVGHRRYPLTHEAILRSMPQLVPFCHPTVILRAPVLRAAGGYQETGYPIEDYELWSRLAKHGARFANLDDVLLHYRVHAGQVKAIRLRDCIRGVLKVKQTYWTKEMDFRAKLRIWTERLMLLLPASLVYRILLAHYYHIIGYPLPSLLTHGRQEQSSGEPPGRLTRILHARPQKSPGM